MFYFLVLFFVTLMKLLLCSHQKNTKVKKDKEKNREKKNEKDPKDKKDKKNDQKDVTDDPAKNLVKLAKKVRFLAKSIRKCFL